MIETLKKNKNLTIKILYIFMLVSYTSAVILYWTVMDRILPGAFNKCLQIVRYLSYLTAVLVIVLRRKEIAKKDRLLVILTFLLCLAGTYFSRDMNVILFWLIFLACYRMPARLTMQTVVTTQIVNFLAVVIPARLGAGTDEQFYFMDRVRHSLGFTWASFASYLLLYICLGELYILGKKLRLWHVGIMVLLAYLIYTLTDTKMAFYTGTVFVVLYYVVVRTGNGNRRISRPAGIFFCLLPFLCFGISQFLYQGYNENSHFWTELNDKMSRRLEFGHNGIVNWGYSVFGQKIEWIGHTFGRADSTDYNFIDGSYLHLLLQNGMVILVLILLVYVCLLYRAVQENNLALCLITAFILLLNITEERLMFPAFNPFPILAMCMVPEGGILSEFQRGKSVGYDFAESETAGSETSGSETSGSQTAGSEACGNRNTGCVSDAGEDKTRDRNRMEPSQVVKKKDVTKSQNNTGKTPSLKKNAVMNGILTISSFIFPLITFPYVSRILGPAGTGRVSFATSFLTYFSMFAEMGIPTYGIRRCAQVRDDKEELNRTVQEILILNLITTLITYLAFGVTLVMVGRVRRDRTLFLIMSLTILFNTIGMEWLYKALEQYTYITIRSLVFKLAAFVLTFLLIKSENDYVLYGLLTIFAASASNIFNFFHVRKYVSLRPVRSYNLKQHLKPLGIFFAMSCAVTVYTQMDTVLLGFMKSDTEVGYYNAAVKIKNVLSGIVSSLGAVLLPRASYYIEHNLKEEFTRISEKALHFVVLIAMPVSLYFILFAREGILFLSGSEYIGAILPMQIIMSTVFFIGMTNIMGMEILVPSGRERAVLTSEIAGGIVDFAINMILIPHCGSVGAAIAALSAEGTVWLVQFLFLKGMITKAYRKIPFGKILTALTVSSLASIWIKKLALGSFLTLAASAVIFFVLYLLLLYVMKEELARELTDRYLIGKLKRG
ncbi:MAG: flippase [Eubacterium sp.]|nr:flippase [Eubacterium sp.]